MTLTRGLWGAVGAAVATAALAVALLLLFIVGGELIRPSSNFELAKEIRYRLEDWVFPILFCTVMGACAGWATFAPEGRHSFVASVLAVLLGSLLIWNVLSLFISHKPSKKEDSPSITLSQALVLLPPPMVVAAILARRRARIQSLATRTAQSL